MGMISDGRTLFFSTSMDGTNRVLSPEPCLDGRDCGRRG